MIPKIVSHATYYPAGDLDITYDGYHYYFTITGSQYLPQSYEFSYDALQTVIIKDAEALNLSLSDYSGNIINYAIGTLVSSVMSMWRSFIITYNKVETLLIPSWAIYGWTYSLTGIDSNYPGHETYGDAYGFRFVGCAGEYIDLVLDQYGDLYGSNVIGNYTSSEDIEEFSQWSITQHDGDDIWMPMNTSGSIQDLRKPYIEGISLHFFVGNDEYIVSDFRNMNIMIAAGYNNYCRLYFYNVLGQDLSQKNITITRNGNPINIYYNNIQFSDWRNILETNQTITTRAIEFSSWLNPSVNLPCFYKDLNVSVAGANNCLGMYGGPVYGYGDIFLREYSLTPMPGNIDLPDDQPIPLDDIPSDPSDYVPSNNPDPVPGIDYPTPEPNPVPLPSIPSVVSGNDDLWPDLNDYFETEDDIIDFTFPAVNVEFPDLSVLLGNFVNSFTWVSTIITALFNGSDFSVLFSVLAFFFIAAAVLGIYKWWK